MKSLLALFTLLFASSTVFALNLEGNLKYVTKTENCRSYIYVEYERGIGVGWNDDKVLIRQEEDSEPEVYSFVEFGRYYDSGWIVLQNEAGENIKYHHDDGLGEFGGVEIGSCTYFPQGPEPNPITVSPQGVEIVGCGLHRKTETEEDIHVLLRYQKAVWLPPFFAPLSEDYGMMLHFHAEQRANGRGLSSTKLPNEGETELAAYGSEDWTHEAPAGTFFTARGNYKGIFLVESGDSAPKALVASWGKEAWLECTSDIHKVKAWMKKAQAFMP
jgi:hypothetical protein